MASFFFFCIHIIKDREREIAYLPAAFSWFTPQNDKKKTFNQNSFDTVKSVEFNSIQIRRNPFPQLGYWKKKKKNQIPFQCQLLLTLWNSIIKIESTNQPSMQISKYVICKSSQTIAQTSEWPHNQTASARLIQFINLIRSQSLNPFNQLLTKTLTLKYDWRAAQYSN